MGKIIFVAVSVEERLPKEEGIYHVLKSSTKFPSTGYFDGYKFSSDYNNIFYWLEQQPKEVVLPEEEIQKYHGFAHWMALPKAPKT
jgi:hypothetical protein